MLFRSNITAFNSVIANAYAIGSYGIVWRDIDTLEVIEPSKFPRWTVSGKNKGGVNTVSRGGNTWERAHFPATGYLAYLLTGQQVHLDTLGHTAALCYLVQSFSYGGGEGEKRLDLGETRGQAWCLRAAGMYAAFKDSGLRTRFAFNISHWASFDRTNNLGITYIGYPGGYGPGKDAPWMQNFRVQTLGFLSDIEPLENMNPLIRLRDFNYKWPVGLLRADWYCYGGEYVYPISKGSFALDELSDWDGLTFEKPCTGKLLRNPDSTNYWANLLPAISYARKHKARGAKSAWKNVEAASNFSAWIKTFRNNAVWGVLPEQ